MNSLFAYLFLCGELFRSCPSTCSHPFSVQICNPRLTTLFILVYSIQVKSFNFLLLLFFPHISILKRRVSICTLPFNWIELVKFHIVIYTFRIWLFLGIKYYFAIVLAVFFFIITGFESRQICLLAQETWILLLEPCPMVGLLAKYIVMTIHKKLLAQFTFTIPRHFRMNCNCLGIWKVVRYRLKWGKFY